MARAYLPTPFALLKTYNPQTAAPLPRRPQYLPDGSFLAHIHCLNILADGRGHEFSPVIIICDGLR